MNLGSPILCLLDAFAFTTLENTILLIQTKLGKSFAQAYDGFTSYFQGRLGQWWWDPSHHWQTASTAIFRTEYPYPCWAQTLLSNVTFLAASGFTQSELDDMTGIAQQLRKIVSCLKWSCWCEIVTKWRVLRWAELQERSGHSATLALYRSASYRAGLTTLHRCPYSAHGLLNRGAELNIFARADFGFHPVSAGQLYLSVPISFLERQGHASISWSCIGTALVGVLLKTCLDDATRCEPKTKPRELPLLIRLLQQKPLSHEVHVMISHKRGLLCCFLHLLVVLSEE